MTSQHESTMAVPVLSHEKRGDRRSRPRMPVSWPIRLGLPSDCELMDACTTNVSTQGFYCLAARPFRVGEMVQGVMHIPAHEPGVPDSFLELAFVAEVVRIESAESDQWGVACRFCDYSAAVVRDFGPAAAGK